MRLRRALRADRVLFVRVLGDEAARVSVVSDEATRAAPIARELPVEVFSDVRLREFRAGRPVVSSDNRSRDETHASAEDHHRLLGVQAYVAVPVLERGRWVATLGVHQNEPRAWTDDEIALVRDTARSTWNTLAALMRAGDHAAVDG